jgi:16S rRNA (cytidine1402-2'-O)-methyltransferase
LGNRNITICRELTKKFEEAFRTSFQKAILFYQDKPPKGECVIVIEGKSVDLIRQEEQSQFLTMPLQEHMEFYEKKGIEKKEAMKQVAKDRGISKREVYNKLLHD